MKAIIASVGGRVPPAQNKLMLCGVFHSPGAAPGFSVPGPLDPVPFLSGHAIAHAAVFLGLLDPFAQGLGNTANLGCNGRNRARLRFVGALMLEHHPDPHVRGPLASSDLPFCFLS
jgi:hypothetical protein